MPHSSAAQLPAGQVEQHLRQSMPVEQAPQHIRVLIIGANVFNTGEAIARRSAESHMKGSLE
ncbi:hypothetical protein [Devosia sp.]|uniref:hypothetical protein n=1 Tax=Devosia sp. TaxID=1871048 RepID=UPI002FC7CE45